LQQETTMKTTVHNTTVAAHAVSTGTISPISHAINQALADSTKPPADQSVANSHLPEIPGFARAAVELNDHTADTPAGADKGHQSAEGMLSSSWSYNYTDSQGDEHEKDITVLDDFYNETDTNKGTGETTSTTDVVTNGELKEFVTIENPSSGETTKIYDDGHVTVVDTDTGDMKWNSDDPQTDNDSNNSANNAPANNSGGTTQPSDNTNGANNTGSTGENSGSTGRANDDDCVNHNSGPVHSGSGDNGSNTDGGTQPANSNTASGDETSNSGSHDGASGSSNNGDSGDGSGITTTTNPDGSTTTGTTDADGTEHYRTDQPDGGSTEQTVTHNDDGTSTVTTTTVNADGSSQEVTENSDGSSDSVDRDSNGVETGEDGNVYQNDTTDAHNGPEDGQSVEPDQNNGDGQAPSGGDNSGDGGAEGEGESSGDGNSADDGQSQEPQSSDDPNGQSQEGDNDGQSTENSADMSQEGGDQYPAGGSDGDPDSSHVSLPPGFGDLMWDSIKQMHSPSHDGDTINVAGDDFSGTVSSAVSGPFVDHAVNNGVSDPGNPAGGFGDGGNFNGSPGSVSPGSGNGNIIHDLDEGTQSNGPEEPNHQQDIKHDGLGTANAGSGQGSADDQSGNTTHLVSLIGKPAETKAQQAADALRDTVAQHNGDERHDAIKEAADKLSGTVHAALDLGHGAHAEQGNVFAELLSAAQNPAHTALLAGVQPSEPDTLHQLTASAGIAGHDLAIHGGEELHASALVAPVIPAHDNFIEHPTPVLDHAWYH
jgi:hypothetical protein